MFNLGIAGNRSRIADECGDFVTLHSLGYIGNGGGSEGLRNRQRASEFVDFDDVGNVAAPTDEADDAAGHNQREKKQPAGRYLPVAFTENEIGVSLVPFSTRFDVRICGHRDTPRQATNRETTCRENCPRNVRATAAERTKSLQDETQKSLNLLGPFGLL